MTRAYWGDSGVGERIAWGLRRLNFNQADLARRAKVTEGHVSRMLKRTEHVGGRIDELERIATALEVSKTWLAFGDGQPLRDVAVPFPRRTLAADLCREAGIDEGAIRAVLDETPAVDEDMPTLVWALEIIRAQERLRKERTERAKGS